MIEKVGVMGGISLLLDPHHPLFRSLIILTKSSIPIPHHPPSIPSSSIRSSSWSYLILMMEAGAKATRTLNLDQVRPIGDGCAVL